MSTTEYREGQLREELALTKQQLKNEMNKSWGLESALAEAEHAIRESQEQEPAGSFVFNEENGYWKQVDKAWAQKLPATKLYKHPVIIPQSAEQLHIKELREALERLTGAHIRLLGIIDEHNIHNIPEDVLEVRLSNEALAKQPDTRTLDKVMLEARIEALEDFGQAAGFGSTKLISLVARYKNTLAELNKAEP